MSDVDDDVKQLHANYFYLLSQGCKHEQAIDLLKIIRQDIKELEERKQDKAK